MHPGTVRVFAPPITVLAGQTARPVEDVSQAQPLYPYILLFDYPIMTFLDWLYGKGIN